MTASVVLVHLVVEHRIVIAAGLLDEAVGHEDGEVGRGCDTCLALLATLGGDEDDTIGAADTEDGRRRGILQHGDALDLVRVDVVEAALHAVNLYEW